MSGRLAAAILAGAVAVGGCGPGDYRPPSRRATGSAAPLGVVLDLEVSLPNLFVDTAGVRGVELELSLEVDGIGDGVHDARVVFESARLATGVPVSLENLGSGEVQVTVTGDAWSTARMGTLLVERTPFEMWLSGTIREDGWWTLDGKSWETQTGGFGSFLAWRRHRFLVASTDFTSSGRVSEVSLVKETEIRVRRNLTSISSDPILRRTDGAVFVVNRLSFDNLQRLDPQDAFATAWQSEQLGTGSNPHDVLLLSPDEALVTRYEPPFNDLLVIDPEDGAMLRSIPLASLAGNPDGTPRPDRMALADGSVFIGLQDIDRTFSRYEEGKLAVLDAATTALWPEAIPLGGKSPGAIEVVAGADGRSRLYVALAGLFGISQPQELSGGVVVVDVAARAVERMALDDDDAGGNIGALAMSSESLGYVVATDAASRNRVLAFDPIAGTVLREILDTGDLVAELEVDGKNVLAVPDRSYTRPQLCLYRVPTGDAETEEFLGCGALDLPPASLEALDN